MIDDYLFGFVVFSFDLGLVTPSQFRSSPSLESAQLDKYFEKGKIHLFYPLFVI